VDGEFPGNADHEGHRDVVSRHCEERSDEAIQSFFVALDCFAELVIGRRSAPTRWLAVTI
jgi:hypothetical protein